MLNVLLESRAPRERRMGSTLASAMLHGALIAGAVALTMPAPVDANMATAADSVIIYVPLPRRPTPAIPDVSRRTQRQVADAPVLPAIAPPDVVPTTLPPIDVGPVLPPDEIVIGAPGSRTSSLGAARDVSTLAGDRGRAIDAELVDRSPRLLGRALEPRYPAPLRDAGVQGRVVVQFVVDTLGRAELDGLQVMETPHPLFVESVRAALERYRFAPGESAGHRVRTRVQLPFDFTLKR